MSVTKIKYDNSLNISITINNFAKLGKTFDDITRVIFLLKASAEQPDAAAPLNKTYPGGGVTLVDEKIVVAIDRVDFGDTGLQSDATYLIAIGIEFNDSGEFYEDKDDKLERNLYVIPDKIRT
jgi:hypothetical protein